MESTSDIAQWATMGLFFGTALVSHLIRRTTKQKVAEPSNPSRLRQLYAHKRLAERMSYEDLGNYLNVLSDRVNGNDHRQSVVDLASGGEQEHEFDFHPKNSNWSHFEESLEGSEDEKIVGEADDESTSSEEAFLWQPLTRKKSMTKDDLSPNRQKTKSPSREPLIREKSWGDQMRTFQQGLGSFIVAVEGESSEGEDVFMDEEKIAFELYGGNESDAKHATYSSKLAPEDDQAHHNRAARATYNARIMPNKVVMVRHGQSEGNVDESLYSRIPDNSMRLTPLGWEQAMKAGQILKDRVIATGEPVHFIVSPYVRTVETFHGIVSAWCDPSEFNHINCREKRLKAWYGHLLGLGLTWHEDPRIREQDFGNYQDPAEIKRCKEERHKFGAFFYRFPHGESASDVFDRVSTFLDSLWRSFDLNKSRNYVLVTHGISIRVLLARYFRYSIDQFSMLANPRNGEMVILGHDGEGKLWLDGRCEIELELDEATGEKKVTGYNFHRRLRVLPKHYVRKIKVRVSPDDTLEDLTYPVLAKSDTRSSGS